MRGGSASSARSAAGAKRPRIAVIVAQITVLPHPFVEAPRLAFDGPADAAHGRELAQRAFDRGLEFGGAAARAGTGQLLTQVVQVDIGRAMPIVL